MGGEKWRRPVSGHFRPLAGKTFGPASAGVGLDPADFFNPILDMTGKAKSAPPRGTVPLPRFAGNGVAGSGGRCGNADMD